MSVAELGLGWRSTGELGIGDELLRRQVATAPVLVHGPNKVLVAWWPSEEVHVVGDLGGRRAVRRRGMRWVGGKDNISAPILVRKLRSHGIVKSEQAVWSFAMSLRMNLGMDGCHSEEVREYFQCAAGQEKRREAKRDVWQRISIFLFTQRKLEEGSDFSCLVLCSQGYIDKNASYLHKGNSRKVIRGRGRMFVVASIQYMDFGRANTMT
ncbi:uncharacterized protein [Triticum aestivum]|uniref:uncharacterized protein isoform X2 n=1 Tax=Triticum aestivum TaxID=4565 RepID=UPI001D00D720|nr:uncharacterized protein LOC123123835 isoform X2 [Triticum aestivum]